MAIWHSVTHEYCYFIICGVDYLACVHNQVVSYNVISYWILCLASVVSE